ncbi:hypothetical protein [Cryptosporangium phraense]|uniref:Uncharacterized protein n=1 Tax=Cryptosporangium phraense TaxID=2593070 RepID=A0A545AR33_9ACTN|nr:hypothetical protein [Cryptosporangium phraense]TQS43777.1 hypothetical protein FL583_17230 [Cryptosporangium phraense]
MIQHVAEVGAAAAITVAHEVAGWLLLVFAVLIVAVAGPRKRSRVFAVLFATAIVLVVVTSWSDPARAADVAAPQTGAGVTEWLVAGSLGAVVLMFVAGSAMFVVAARAAWAFAVSAFRFALGAAVVLGLLVAVLSRTV